jgi:hypothetical protein
MAAVERVSSVPRLAAPQPAAPQHGCCVDGRFRNLLGERAWLELPEAVRRRFSKHIAAGHAVLYRGRVAETRVSAIGRILSATARLIGSPLPDARAQGAAVVSVINDPASNGQNWTRTYARPGRFPQVVHSMKRFQGPTGLEEYVGAGTGMALVLSVEDHALVFRSAHYFLSVGPVRVRLPRWLEPGRMEIIHRDLGSEFLFSLSLVHPWFGELVHQDAYFVEVL